MTQDEMDKLFDSMHKDILYKEVVLATARMTAVVGTVVKNEEERKDLVERITGICTLIMKHMGIEPNKSFDETVVQLQTTVEKWQ